MLDPIGPSTCGQVTEIRPHALAADTGQSVLLPPLALLLRGSLLTRE